MTGCVCVCVYTDAPESLLSLPVPLLKLSVGWNPSLPSALHWLRVLQHCQRCPWHRSVALPHSSYGYLSCLFSFNFLTNSELQGIGVVILEPEGLLTCCMVYGLKRSTCHRNWAWNLPSCLKNKFALSSLMGMNTDYCLKNNSLSPTVILARLWYAIRTLAIEKKVFN